MDRVYPRVCGGALVEVLKGAAVWGLSPRVRGSRGRVRIFDVSLGSIPACAGEPAAASKHGANYWVYPRVCGGAMHRRITAQRREGLSPRVRGSRGGSSGGSGGGGSIPACAGEPYSVMRQGFNKGVYPRVCGGALKLLLLNLPVEGLSPRVRGSQPSALKTYSGAGSIPACAGEPRTSGTSRSVWGVYPRVCGGAKLGRTMATARRGLSPRVRGSLIVIVVFS